MNPADGLLGGSTNSLNSSDQLPSPAAAVPQPPPPGIPPCGVGMLNMDDALMHFISTGSASAFLPAGGGSGGGGAAAAPTAVNEQPSHTFKIASVPSSYMPASRCFKRCQKLNFADSITALLHLPPLENREDLQQMAPQNPQQMIQEYLAAVEAAATEVCDRPEVQQAMQQCNLDGNDIRILIAYTMELPFSIENWINAWLMTSRSSDKIIDGVGPTFNLLYRALEKLPPFQTTAATAISVEDVPAFRDTFLNYQMRLRPGNSLNFWALKTFSTDPYEINSSDFMGSVGEEVIVYACPALTGVNIEIFKPRGIPQRARIVPLAPSCFRVVSASMLYGCKLTVTLNQLDNDQDAYVVNTKGQRASEMIKNTAAMYGDAEFIQPSMYGDDGSQQCNLDVPPQQHFGGAMMGGWVPPQGLGMMQFAQPLPQHQNQQLALGVPDELDGTMVSPMGGAAGVPMDWAQQAPPAAFSPQHSQQFGPPPPPSGVPPNPNQQQGPIPPGQGFQPFPPGQPPMPMPVVQPPQPPAPQGSEPPCTFGAKCTRNNPDHWRNSPHPPLCQFGAQCQNQDDSHRTQCSHPPAHIFTLGPLPIVGQQQPPTVPPPQPGPGQPPQLQPQGTEPPCQFGAKCTRNNPEHWRNSPHPPLCVNGPQCPNQDPAHRVQCSHPPEHIFALPAPPLPIAGGGGALQVPGQSPQQPGTPQPPSPQPPSPLPPNQSPSQPQPPSAPGTTSVPACQFGAKCTRNNTDHWRTSGHPALCSYGPQCHNHDPAHRSKFSHPPAHIFALPAPPLPQFGGAAGGVSAPSPAPPSSKPKSNKKPICKFSAGCTDADLGHWKKYWHPHTCKYHPNCTDMNVAHRTQYSHPPCPNSAGCKNPEVTHWQCVLHPIICRDGINCTDMSTNHREKYSHPPFDTNPKSMTFPVPPYWSKNTTLPSPFKMEITDDSELAHFHELIKHCTDTSRICMGADLAKQHGPHKTGYKWDGITVRRVWRVENRGRWDLYSLKRDSFVQKMDQSIDYDVQSTKESWMTPLDREHGEMYLFHGTKHFLIDTLCTNGFNPKFGTVKGMFGAGTYFAEDCAKVDQYCHPDDDDRYYMFLARVTMGKIWKHPIGEDLNGALQAPGPATVEGKKYTVKEAHDSVLGQASAKSFREFVVYDGDIAYPEFIIQYSRNRI